MSGSQQPSFEDRFAITALNDDFGYHLDNGNVDEFLALFTDDILYSNTARILSGKAEMEAFFRNRAAGGRVSRHIYSGLRLSFKSATLAHSTSIWLTFAGSGTIPISPADPFVVADINDVYRLDGDGMWRFAERHIKQVFVNKSIPQVVKPQGA